MPVDFPVNDKYIRLKGTAAYVAITDSVSLSGGNRIAVTVDVQFDVLPGTTRNFCGKNGGADFSFTVTAAGIVSFITRRSGGTKTAATSAAQAIVAGRRYILTGIDDGSNVTLYVNGTPAATTVASATGAIVADTNPTLIGADGLGTNLSDLFLWAFQWVRDDQTMVRLYVREESGTTLLDTSVFGNTVTVTGGVEGTDFFYGSDMSYEPIWPGGSTL